MATVTKLGKTVTSVNSSVSGNVFRLNTKLDIKISIPIAY